MDLDKRTATVTIHTNEESFKMTFELDKVSQELKALSTNLFAQKILNLLGFKIEVEKEGS